MKERAHHPGEQGEFAAFEIDRLVLKGADRVKFLHGFCTADIKRMHAGEIREALILNTKGKLVGQVQVLCAEQVLELVTWPGQASVLREHLDRYLIREKVEFEVFAGEGAWFVWSEARAALSNLSELAPGHWRETEYPPGLCLVGCGEFCGPGYLLLPRDGSSPAKLAKIAERLENSLGLRRQAADELERHRIGNRYPKFGVDADSETLPQELQRDAQAISFDKGCYLGQETVARIDALGHVNRLLVGLRWESGPLPQLPAELIESDSRVGRMTSLASGSSAVRGLAIVKRAAARPGVQLRCGEAVFTVE
ncbi:MAG: hypothetical protein LW697_12170 [Blastopirellula sp.]|nr:hypothetical protein [Blastopirellula sp.]